ncbi:Homeodomain-like DNA binding domain-containing transcription factor [Brachionus plicatilis]|uniref:Homeodomain-like DNA binding domain-containing transcription factor n=1 Tax=Brachionus plicatilis TaxID=10195 RepID=A0A3M7PGQ4_BRAPC|nr:Homeodomain-like DNA binding domain-containing transcription factor [Brachionus plicatilis]
MDKKGKSNEVSGQIIRFLKNKAKSNRETANLVGVSEKNMRTTGKNNDTYGTPKESTRPGRSRKLTYKNQYSLFIQISRETVGRFLTRKGIGTYTALKKPLLTASDRIKRLKWCKETLNWTIERWEWKSRVVLVSQEYEVTSAVKVQEAVVYMRGELINTPTRKR